MSQTPAKIVFAASVAALFAVGAAWFSGATDPKADLTGNAVRRSNVRGSADDAGAGLAAKRSASLPKTRSRIPAATSGTLPPASSESTADGATRTRPTFPKRIVIPSLGVNADVVSVGLETDGSMEIPGATEAGWYHYGPRPGDAIGSAVLAGHVDHQKEPGVFVELRKIELGSDIEVTDASGASHRFRVTERFQIDKDELPADELFRSDGAPVLTLITCGGRFSSRSRNYADNIVIRATPLPSYGSGQLRGRGIDS